MRFPVRIPWKNFTGTRALDPAYEREQRISEQQEDVLKAEAAEKDDSFDAFCRRQQVRVSARWERGVARVRSAQPDTEAFESRK
jgi:hypothetical protein